ncbi:MAG TPA: dTDP-4-dehydrorhamnose reductase [Candidatus Eisenbacteria bacterium]
MRILITGANGILGRALRDRLEAGHTLYLWGREEADLTDETATRAAAKGIEFDAVIHTAAFTDVDRCETEFDNAMKVNRDGTAHVAGLARERGATLVAISSDYVFDGEKGTPYLEEDPPRPLSAYGKTKLASEEAALRSGAPCLVVRTSWLFGAGGKNFVDTVAERLTRGEALRVVDDQRGSPTYARDLAHGIELLLRRGATGVVHVTNAGDTTWHGLAVEIARYLGVDAPIVPIRSEELRRPAPRPAYSVLSGDRFRALTGDRLPPWQNAVHRHLAGRGTGMGEAA